MRRLLMLLVALPASVIAAPPYDVTATLPSTAGADSCRLYMGGVLVAERPCDSAETFPDLITADGTYTFTYTAVNEAGESSQSPPTTVTVSEIPLPANPGSPPQIQVTCDPCVLTIN